MAKVAYIDNVGLSKQNLDRLETINRIIEEYAADGYVLTLRQLYYQLVARGVLPNSDKEYKKMGSILGKGRMAGIVDWDAIEDRTRRPQRPYWVTGIPGALDDTINQYRLDRMDGQDYIEVWVEKDALSGVLKRITERYHIRLMVNKGYSSITAMHDAAERMEYEDGVTILYLGDHDPSGLDMVRDIEERLNGFGIENLDVVPIALTHDQIQQYNPPPNPAKVTDPRAGWYIEQFGTTSWEVDALPPAVLHEILEGEIRSRIDIDLYEDMVQQEREDKDELRRFRDEVMNRE